MLTEKVFWEQMCHHWRIIGRFHQLEREPATVKLLAREWFGAIQHLDFSDSECAEVFAHFRMLYSTTEALSSTHCFVKAARDLASSRTRRTSVDTESIGTKTLSAEDNYWLPLNRFVLRFVLNTTGGGAPVNNKETERRKLLTDEEQYTEILKDCFKWANTPPGVKAQAAFPGAMELLKERLALRGEPVEE